VLVVAVFFLVGFVVPRFTRMYASKKMSLPYVTQVLIWLGNSAQNYWYMWVAGAVGAFFLVRALWRSRSGRERLERLLHKVPGLSSLLVGVAVARFARVFGLCLSSGLSLIDSLTMAGAASGRTALQKDVTMIVDQVRNGGRLATILPSCAYLPGFARRMLTSGEETAELSRMCGVVAKHYERDTSIISKNMATLIEPLLIVVIAGVVLTVAMGIFLPMWDMLKLMG
jgi:type II secretory pathway component PulF